MREQRIGELIDVPPLFFVCQKMYGEAREAFLNVKRIDVVQVNLSGPKDWNKLPSDDTPVGEAVLNANGVDVLQVHLAGPEGWNKLDSHDELTARHFESKGLYSVLLCQKSSFVPVIAQLFSDFPNL